MKTSSVGDMYIFVLCKYFFSQTINCVTVVSDKFREGEEGAQEVSRGPEWGAQVNKEEFTQVGDKKKYKRILF